MIAEPHTTGDFMPLYRLRDRVPRVHSSAFVHAQAVLIGDVEVAAGANIWPHAVLRADYGSIRVGRGSSVQDGTVIHPSRTHPALIGADVVIGHRVHLDGCVIEDLVLVGSGAVILEGALIRRGALIAAGALVTGGMEVGSGQRAQGVPARMARNTMSIEDVRSGARLYQRNAAHYAEHQVEVDHRGNPVRS